MVLLLGENHKKLWSITKETFRKIVPTDTFPAYQENFPV
jgi:predicted oxidoreductase (fatty acid repression mutant protein)